MNKLDEFRDEFNENLLSDTPSIQIIVWQKDGSLAKHLPELNKCVGVSQDPKFHQDDVFTHCIKTCDNVPPKFYLRWAALLHDTGKADTAGHHVLCKLHFPEKKIINYCHLKKKKCSKRCEHAVERITFYRHEIASERLAKRALKRFKIKHPSDTKAINLINLHMYNYTFEWGPRALSRFIINSGITKKDLDNPDEFPLFRLRIADRVSRGLIPVTQRQRDFESRLLEYFDENIPNN